YVTDRGGLEAFASGGLSTTDDRPRLEHAALVRREDFLTVLDRLLALQTAPIVSGASEDFDRALRIERERLHAFYRAAMLWYQGKLDEMSPLLERVLREDDGNPYYRWFIGAAG
ncbi:MAG: spermidine synthase, partial [Candidatus Binatia bacterium]